MERIIIILAFFFIYYHISGLATTNILRLTAGNSSPVLAAKCYCNHCGTAITPFFQLPILSFLLCGGKCRSCKAQIPLFPLWLEMVVLIGMFSLSALFCFSFSGITCSFLLYELIRFSVILYLGKREVGFKKQTTIAMLSMLPFYLLTLFVALLYRII